MTLVPPATRREMISQMTRQFTRDILVDAARCDGCDECVAACRQAVARRHPRIKPVARIAIRSLDGVHVPLLCRNCTEAPCTVACMTACRIRTESHWVETDYDRCVGCWMCIMACPWGAIVPDYEEKLALKCDGCVEDEVPACMAACKSGALRRGGSFDLSQDRRQAFARRVVI